MDPKLLSITTFCGIPNDNDDEDEDDDDDDDDDGNNNDDNDLSRSSAEVIAGGHLEPIPTKIVFWNRVLMDELPKEE